MGEVAVGVAVSVPHPAAPQRPGIAGRAARPGACSGTVADSGTLVTWSPTPTSTPPLPNGPANWRPPWPKL